VATRTKSSVVIQVQPTMDTAQRFVPNDSATVTAASGAGNLAGTVRLRLYDDATCTPAGTTLYDKTFNIVTDGTGTGLSRTVSSDNPTSYSMNTSFSWLVEYASTNTGQRSVTSTCNDAFEHHDRQRREVGRVIGSSFQVQPRGPGAKRRCLSLWLRRGRPE
jgi:hypothetical protein